MNVARRLGALVAGTIAAVSVAACSYPTNTQSGGACVRSLECAAGLVCSQRHCTNDLSMFGMGHPVSLDAGVGDAGPARDGGGDAGPPHDANLPDMGAHDAYVRPTDAHVPPTDAFVPPTDAFVPPIDAFVPPVDAFVSVDTGATGG